MWRSCLVVIIRSGKIFSSANIIIFIIYTLLKFLSDKCYVMSLSLTYSELR